MMIQLVRRFRDAVDEGDRIGESLEDECLGERVAASGPAREAAESALNFEIGKFLPHRCEVVRVPERRHGSYRLRSQPAIRLIVARGKLAAFAILSLAAAARAQSADTVSSPRYYWKRFSYGVAVSILFHEAAHIVTAMAVGGHPTFGFDKLRPTVYSGIDVHIAPHKQFLFSAAGLTAQTLLDE